MSMIPVYPGIYGSKNGNRISKFENVLKLNEQLRVNTTTAAK
ncbi:hypothetical protein MKY85_21915 [Paenibacillus sp. FSL R5-0749]